MGTWNTRGLRGSTLEELINRTNEQYLEKNLALIQKIPTPITPVRMDKEHRQITLAYFEQRSTVDYIGAVQGIPVCFDAKECAGSTFPIQNIHEHQVVFMEQFERQGGIDLVHHRIRPPRVGRGAIRADGVGQGFTVERGHHRLLCYRSMIAWSLWDRTGAPVELSRSVNSLPSELEAVMPPAILRVVYSTVVPSPRVMRVRASSRSGFQARGARRAIRGVGRRAG